MGTLGTVWVVVFGMLAACIVLGAVPTLAGTGAPAAPDGTRLIITLFVPTGVEPKVARGIPGLFGFVAGDDAVSLTPVGMRRFGGAAVAVVGLG